MKVVIKDLISLHDDSTEISGSGFKIVRGKRSRTDFEFNKQ